MKLLLFDIDGTLILSGGAGIRALNRAFCQVVDIVNALDGIRLHGKTDPAIVREVFTALGRSEQTHAHLEEILEIYLSLLPEEVGRSNDYTVLPGILRFLDDFRSHANLAFGLATGNLERGARIKLDRGNLNSYFSFGGFGSDSENRTDLVVHAAEDGMRFIGERIDPSDIFVIGDTPRDVEAGREAGFRTIAVATGLYTGDELESADPDLIVADLDRGRDAVLELTGIV